MSNKVSEDWDLVIKPSGSPFSLGISDVWRYRDLLSLMVKRDIVTVYKQTILGPIWFFLQPILMTIVFTVIFGNIASIPTDGIPKILFYLSGLTIWNFFADTLNNTSKTFTENAAIFGKVYFPRIIMPLSKVISGLIKFLIQFGLFIIVLFYYKLTGTTIALNWSIIFLPYLIFLMGGLGLGAGIILSSLTTKYRDLTFLISFGVQLLMYATPVIIPLKSVRTEYKWILELNPMTSIIESFRSSFLGQGDIASNGLMYTSIFTFALLFIGIFIFNKVEKTFIDTV